MKNLMIFENKEVEVFEFNGQALFNPKHVAECLDIVDVNSSIRTFNEKQVIKLTNSNMHNMQFRKLHNTGENFLTESGVYKLIFKSHKEEAEKFQDWVTDEVLPSIRKHGLYITDELLKDKQKLEFELDQYMQKYEQLEYEKKLVESKNEEIEEEVVEFRKQRQAIFRLSVKTGQDESYLPDLALQVIREYVLNNKEVVIEVNESGYKVKKRLIMKELNKLILRKQDIIYVLGCLRINIEDNYIFIRQEFMDKGFKPIGSLYL